MADDPYLIPGTDVLANRLRITDGGRLATAEHGLTAIRLDELGSGAVTLNRSYDLDHLRAVHRHVFQDVYDWAGQLRSATNIRKEGDDKQFVSSDLVPIKATMLFNEVKAANYLRGQPLDVFVDNCAGLLAELNELHGFRDGNGRAQREYLRELAEDAGYQINWAGIDADANNAASRASMAGESLDHRPFIPLLRSIITPAGPTNPPPVSRIAENVGRRSPKM